MKFHSYMHVEKISKDIYNAEIENLTNGKNVYVFPKIDGANACIYCKGFDEAGKPLIYAGSRRRELSIEEDNAGFAAHVLSFADALAPFFIEHPNFILYGEWLCPHTIKTYESDAWRKFYLFDVGVADPEEIRKNTAIGHGTRELFTFLPYDMYKSMLQPYEEYVNIIPPLAIVDNPSFEDLLEIAKKNTYLIKEDAGIGEGVVVKRYDFRNRFNRTTWGKIVINEFLLTKREHSDSKKKAKEDEHLFEYGIAKKFVTRAFLEKEIGKYAEEHLDGDIKRNWTRKHIGALIKYIWETLVAEEGANILTYSMRQTISVPAIRAEMTNRLRLEFPELF